MLLFKMLLTFLLLISMFQSLFFRIFSVVCLFCFYIVSLFVCISTLWFYGSLQYIELFSLCYQMYLFIISNFVLVNSFWIIFFKILIRLPSQCYLQLCNGMIGMQFVRQKLAQPFFVFHVSVYDKDLDPMITLNKRFKTLVRKIFPRFIVCRRLRTQGRCRKLLRLCWPLHLC